MYVHYKKNKGKYSRVCLVKGNYLGLKRSQGKINSALLMVKEKNKVTSNFRHSEDRSLETMSMSLLTWIVVPFNKESFQSLSCLSK